MKQKKEVILKLLTFGIILILSSCSEDLFDDNNQTNRKFILKEKRIEELVTDSKFINSIKTNNDASKTIMEEFYGFSIDSTASIKEIKYSNNTTYTLNIIMDSLQENTLNNLIVHVDSLDNTKAWIATYNLLNSTVPTVHQSFRLNYTSVTYKKINYNINSTAKANSDCFENIIIMCNNDGSGGIGEGHAAGPVCCSQGTHLYTIFTSTCTGTGSDTILTSPTDSPHGGGGGSPALADPCKKIKNQNAKFPSLKQSLVALATTTSQNYENGIFIDNTATATTTNPVQTIPSNTTNGGSIPLNMTPTNSYVMIAHTHDSYGTDGTGTYSIFSWDDLTTINNLIKNNHIDNSNFVFYVITADGTRYALTVDNPSKLSNFFYDPSNLPFGTQVDVTKLLETQRIFEKYYDKKANGLISTTSTANNDKTNFLKFIKEANLGITLFEVDATFSTYEKLSISNSGVVTPTPCN